jgi:inner membrane protein
MDILSHAFTGLAVGTVVASLGKLRRTKKIVIMAFGFLGGALPDIDAISLWSKFDLTIGSWLNLSHSGKYIYSAKLWYSHHAALHSVLAALLFALLPSFIKLISKPSNFKAHLMHSWKPQLAFVLGYLFHLLEDMPTPASSWGGVRLFFPSTEYLGGYGRIWWWNNYDLFLIIMLVILLNLFLHAVLFKRVRVLMCSCALVFVMGLSLFLYQIKTRTIDFSYSGLTNNYAEMETQSKEIQKTILGKRLYTFMEALDQKIPFYF